MKVFALVCFNVMLQVGNAMEYQEDQQYLLHFQTDNEEEKNLLVRAKWHLTTYVFIIAMVQALGFLIQFFTLILSSPGQGEGEQIFMKLLPTFERYSQFMLYGMNGICAYMVYILYAFKQFLTVPLYPGKSCLSCGTILSLLLFYQCCQYIYYMVFSRVNSAVAGIGSPIMGLSTGWGWYGTLRVINYFGAKHLLSKNEKVVKMVTYLAQLLTLTMFTVYNEYLIIAEVAEEYGQSILFIIYNLLVSAGIGLAERLYYRRQPHHYPGLAESLFLISKQDSVDVVRKSLGVITIKSLFTNILLCLFPTSVLFLAIPNSFVLLFLLLISAALFPELVRKH